MDPQNLKRGYSDQPLSFGSSVGGLEFLDLARFLIGSPNRAGLLLMLSDFKNESLAREIVLHAETYINKGYVNLAFQLKGGVRDLRSLGLCDKIGETVKLTAKGVQLATAIKSWTGNEYPAYQRAATITFTSPRIKSLFLAVLDLEKSRTGDSLASYTLLDALTSSAHLDKSLGELLKRGFARGGHHDCFEGDFPSGPFRLSSFGTSVASKILEIDRRIAESVKKPNELTSN